MRKPALRHVAFIMDGNRRWAQQHGVGELYSDQALRAVFEAAAACKEYSVSYMTLYAFSLENLAQRDEALKKHVFDAVVRGCSEKKALFLEHNIKVRFIGKRELFTAPVLQAITEIEAATATLTGITLQVLFCYGAQQEIADAASRIARDVVAGELSAASITPERFSSYLWTAPAPPPELIIRTGGASRLSNFLLYQAAYSELVFLDCLWPDLSCDVVRNCLRDFSLVKRNFGA